MAAQRLGGPNSDLGIQTAVTLKQPPHFLAVGFRYVAKMDAQVFRDGLPSTISNSTWLRPVHR